MKELKLKDEECEKLSRVRNELEAELEELTASLFQVCYNCENINSNLLKNAMKLV